jgi:hypothetical protein
MQGQIMSLPATMTHAPLGRELRRPGRRQSIDGLQIVVFAQRNVEQNTGIHNETGQGRGAGPNWDSRSLAQSGNG